MATQTEKIEYSTVLMIAGMPTDTGRIYPPEVLSRLMERFTLKPEIIIQEMNPVERELKKIPIAEPWDKKIMATVKRAELIEGKLVIHFVCKNNKDGRKLTGIIDTMGINAIDFIPVGYGTANEAGIVAPTYRLNYIAVELRKPS